MLYLSIHSNYNVFFVYTQSKNTSIAKLIITLLLNHNRGLDFTAQALRRNISNPSEELTQSFSEAYGVTLKKYHNFLVKGVFSVALKACPYRKDFYEKLGQDQTKVHEQMEAWLGALEKIVTEMQGFYSTSSAAKF